MDVANDYMERITSAAVAAALVKPAVPTATGLCLYCRTPQKQKERRWCDADCRDAWEVAQ